MKKVKLLLIVLLFLTNVIYSFNVKITKPSMCTSLKTGYTVTGLNSTIQIKFHAEGGPSNSYWYAYINGNLVYTGYSYGDNEVVQNIPFPSGYCLNTDAVLQVNMYELNNPGYMAIGYGYFRTYYSGNYGSCSQYRAAVNGSSAEVWYGTQGWSHVNPCGWSTGSSAAHRYKVDFYVTFEYFSNPSINLDLSRCNGFSAANGNNQTTWATVDNVTHTSAHFYTFVYYAYHNATSQWEWWPCSPQEAAVAYSIQNNVPPAGLTLVEVPPVISTYGRIYAYLTQGNCCNVRYNFSWDIPVPNGITISQAQNTDNFVTITRQTDNNSKDIPPVPTWKVYCYAQNDYGYTSTVPITPVFGNYSGGCPWIVVLDNDSSYTVDNNILNKSEYPQNAGSNITDKYLLNVTPGVFDNKITIKVFETVNDSDFFDQFKLYKVSHPSGTKIGITENNDIVMYYTSDVLSTDSATLNGEDITPEVQYKLEGYSRSPVSGDTTDHIYAHFPSIDPSENICAVIQTKQNPDHPIINYKCADNIIINIGYEEFPSTLSQRENPSVQVIPFNTSQSGEVLADIDWNRNYLINYVSLVNYYSSGFTVTELPLSTATHSCYGDIFENLYYFDSIYSELDSTSFIDLQFSTNTLLNLSAPTNVTDYILETHGKYSKLNEGDSRLINYLNSPTTLKNFKLYNNYPNPFNPITLIKFDVAKSNLITIKIYDIIGREVATLVNSIMQPGSYTVEFNGKNLASGVYFYKLESPDFTDVKKMVLIK